MSNHSFVSPYDTTPAEQQVTDSAESRQSPASDVVRWLLETTEKEKEATERYRQKRRQELVDAGKSAQRLAGQGLERLVSIDLDLKNPQSLISAAEALGYRQERLTTVSSHNQILLRNGRGERLAIGRNAKGLIKVDTADDPSRIEALVHRNVLNCALALLSDKDMQVKTASLQNGDVQILAHEQVAQASGAAEIKAQVHRGR